jgi:hypothetical protein
MTCLVDLALQYGVVAESPANGVTNSDAINAAIQDHSGSRDRLVLPNGRVYLGRATPAVGQPPTRWSIHFPASATDLALVGRGMFSTELIVQGPGLGRDWHGIFVNGGKRIELADFGISHGKVSRPDEQTHLITVKDPREAPGTRDIVGHHLSFGRAIGDGLRLLGDTTPVTNVRFTDFVMHLGGSARSGIAMQRGWRNVEFGQFAIDGVRNSEIDIEPSGGAPMEHLSIHDALLNHTGRSDVALSIAGINKTKQLASHIRVSRVTVLGGSVGLRLTRNLAISDLTVITAPKKRQAVLSVFNDNVDVRLTELHLERLAAGKPGNVLHVQNRIGPTTITDSTIIQGTLDHPVTCEESSNVRIASSEIRFLPRRGASNFNGVQVLAAAQNANNVQLQTLHVVSGAKLQAAVRIAARAGRQMLNVRITDIVSPGAAKTGLYIAYHPNAMADLSPYMVGLDNGTDETWREVDNNDKAITRVCPCVGGNRHHVCQMVGHAHPDTRATAMQGSVYTLEAGDATQRFAKATGVGNTGWVLL